MTEFRKYILNPINEEWLLIFETRIHGLFYNVKTEQFRRYPRKQYVEPTESQLYYWSHKKRNPKMRATTDYVKIETPLMFPSGMVVEDLNGNNITIFHYQDGKYYSIRNFDSEISILSSNHLGKLAKNIILLNEI